MRMAWIIYLPSSNGLGERFSKLITTEVPARPIEMYRTFEDFSQRLRRPGVRVAVLFAMTKRELAQVLSLGDFLADVKSIFVLADQDRDTMSKAHQLRPRYITWADRDPADVVAVLKKMIDLYDLPLPGEGLQSQI
jgi:hypothetical protein